MEAKLKEIQKQMTKLREKPFREGARYHRVYLIERRALKTDAYKALLLRPHEDLNLGHPD